jgi:hypothetical protein
MSVLSAFWTASSIGVSTLLSGIRYSPDFECAAIPMFFQSLTAIARP